MLRDLFSLFPAYAGVIPESSTAPGPNSAFPRTCGGDPTEGAKLSYFDSFSPHMRG